MQAGYVPNSHMGTTLDVNYDNPPDQSYAHAVFKQSMNQIEGVNEKKIVYPKFSTALQGMNLSKVPTGGFSGPPPNILIGSDTGGSMFNASNPTYFNQPGNTTGGRRVEVSNGVPLTGEKPGAELVYKQADGKFRDQRGATTVARAMQEFDSGKRRMDRAHNMLLGGYDGNSPVDPMTYTNYPDAQDPNNNPQARAVAANAQVPQTRPTALAAVSNTSTPAATVPTSRTPYSSTHPAALAVRSDSSSDVPEPTASIPITGTIIIADMPMEKPNIRKFGTALWKLMNGTLDSNYQANFWAYNWPYLVTMILFLLFIVLLCVAIAVANKNSTIVPGASTNLQPMR